MKTYKLWPSMLPLCPARQWYIWEKGLTEQEENLRMDFGSLIHKGFQGIAIEEGYQVEVKKTFLLYIGDDSELILSGKADILYPGRVEEIKVCFGAYAEDVPESMVIQAASYKWLFPDTEIVIRRVWPFQERDHEYKITENDILKAGDRIKLFMEMFFLNEPVCSPMPGECLWCNIPECQRKPEEKSAIPIEYTTEDLRYYELNESMKAMELEKKALGARLMLRKDWGNYSFQHGDETYATRFQRGVTVFPNLPAKEKKKYEEWKEKYKQEKEYWYPVVKNLKKREES
jgi:hypothetical protein